MTTYTPVKAADCGCSLAMAERKGSMIAVIEPCSAHAEQCAAMDRPPWLLCLPLRPARWELLE